MKAIVLVLALFFFVGCACNSVKKDEMPAKAPALQVVKPVSTLDHTYCSKCGGLGLVKCTYCDGYGISGDCFACHGTGRQGTMRCLVCHGTGNAKCPFCKGFGIKKCTNEVSEGAR